MNETDIVKGLKMGIRQRAIWFHKLLEAAEAQGCDIEKLTDDAIFTYGQEVGAEAPGTEPLDCLHHFCGPGPFWDVFEKEILEEGEDRCVAHFHRCPLVDAWREYGLSEERIDQLCNLANKGDFGRASHFVNAALDFPTSIGGGDEYCTLLITRKAAE